MKKRISYSRKLFAITSLVLLGGLLMTGFSTSQTGAAPSNNSGPSINECSKVSDPAACKAAFKNCDKQTNETPSICKSIYLNQQAIAGAQQAPPESQCGNTSNPTACKTAYEKCGSGDTACKQKAISDQLLNQVNSPNQGGIGQGEGCTGSSCGHQCGASDQDPYTPAIDIGCQGKGNPIMDAIFGIIRFLSAGVGLVVIGSIIVGGIQYSGSRGDPQSTAMAINRIRSSLYALLIYIFAYAMLNYLIPGAVLQ